MQGARGAGLVARSRVRQPHLNGLDIPSPAGAHRRSARGRETGKEGQRRATRTSPTISGAGDWCHWAARTGFRTTRLATRHAGPQPRSQRRELFVTTATTITTPALPDTTPNWSAGVPNGLERRRIRQRPQRRAHPARSHRARAEGRQRAVRRTTRGCSAGGRPAVAHRASLRRRERLVHAGTATHKLVQDFPPRASLDLDGSRRGPVSPGWSTCSASCGRSIRSTAYRAARPVARRAPALAKTTPALLGQNVAYLPARHRPQGAYRDQRAL